MSKRTVGTEGLQEVGGPVRLGDTQHVKDQVQDRELPAGEGNKRVDMGWFARPANVQSKVTWRVDLAPESSKEQTGGHPS
jgi:hypothetical protein